MFVVVFCYCVAACLGCLFGFRICLLQWCLVVCLFCWCCLILLVVYSNVGCCFIDCVSGALFSEYFWFVWYYYYLLVLIDLICLRFACQFGTLVCLFGFWICCCVCFVDSVLTLYCFEFVCWQLALAGFTMCLCVWLDLIAWWLFRCLRFTLVYCWFCFCWFELFWFTRFKCAGFCVFTLFLFTVCCGFAGLDIWCYLILLFWRRLIFGYCDIFVWLVFIVLIINLLLHNFNSISLCCLSLLYVLLRLANWDWGCYGFFCMWLDWFCLIDFRVIIYCCFNCVCLDSLLGCFAALVLFYCLLIIWFWCLQVVCFVGASVWCLVLVWGYLLLWVNCLLFWISWGLLF